MELQIVRLVVLPGPATDEILEFSWSSLWFLLGLLRTKFWKWGPLSSTIQQNFQYIYIYICLYLYFIYIVFLVPTPISPTIKAYTMSQCELATLSQCLQVRLALKEYHIITVPIGLHYPSVPQTRLALSQCQPVPTTLSQCRRVMLAAITVPAAGSYHSASMVALSQCNHIALSQCKRSHYLSATLKETLSQCFG